MKLAKEFNGEIICADSRTIYKGMDIGTAKPTVAEQKAVPHWGLDLVNPGEAFSAAKFKNYAEAKIKDIQNRGKLPILVGGTGLYVDGVLFNFGFIASFARTDPAKREELENLSIEELQEIVQKNGYVMPENAKNRRHLVRTIERQGQQGAKSQTPVANSLIIGLMPPDEVLKKRIAARAEQIFKLGIIKETQGLLNKYGKRALTGTGGIVYKIVIRVISREIDETQAKELFKTADWQYARRQKTWFKHNAHIKWFSSGDMAYKAVKK